jgi:hypothetical protein
MRAPRLLTRVLSTKRLRVLASLATMLAPQWGCRIDGATPREEMKPVLAEPGVQIFDYVVTESSSGAILAQGCGATNDTREAFGYCDEITVQVPLETEYDIDIRSLRFAPGKLSSEQDRDYFCQLTDTRPPLSHINPLCYRSAYPAYHELLDVRLLDSDGNRIVLNKYDMSVKAQPGDVQHYRLRPQEYLPVYLTLAEPCGLNQIDACLVNFLPP